MKKIVGYSILFFLILFVLYQVSLPSLIQQVKNPQGFIGRFMIHTWNKTFVPMTKWGLQNVSLTPQDTILDIGCGGGQTTKSIISINERITITAIDISAESIAIAQETVHQDKAVTFQVADVHKLPFKNEEFTKVFAFQTHMYWDDVPLALSEIYRVSAPNSQFYIIAEKDKIVSHLPQYQSTSEMTDLLSSVGFNNVTAIEQGNWSKYIATKRG